MGTEKQVEMALPKCQQKGSQSVSLGRTIVMSLQNCLIKHKKYLVKLFIFMALEMHIHRPFADLSVNMAEI